MSERQVGERQLARATRLPLGTLSHYRQARNLPSLAMGIALAEALDSPRLAALILELRTQVCVRPSCGMEFVNPGLHQLYCSDFCKRVAEKGRRPNTRERAMVAERVLAETEAELRRQREAVRLMCRDCEPEGVCRLSTCPLRPVSPLPLVGVPDVPIVRPYPGVHAVPEDLARRSAAVRAANARRFSDPAAREHLSQLARAQRAKERAARERAQASPEVVS
jgi:hypothetical protein